MSEPDDPFGRSDRTIVRPNPGGRRPASPPPEPPLGGAKPASTPTPPVNYPPPPHWGGAPPTRWNQGPSGQSPREIWASPGAGGQRDLYAPQAETMPMTPAASGAFVPVDLLPVSHEPILRLASPLLMLLGRLRASLSQGNAAQLMDQVYQSIGRFETDARAAGVPADQAEAGKYALAATADDIVQNLPDLDPRIWTQYSMLARHFRERQGGVRFFEELKKAQMNPSLNVGLLELMHACLALGFEGKYRATRDIGGLQTLRRDLYETIRRHRAKTIEELSPHWRGRPVALAGSRFEVPIWAVAATALATLLVVFIVFRTLLGWRHDALEARASTLFPQQVAIWHLVKPPPPPPPPASRSTQFERVNAGLSDELGRTVTTELNAKRIIVRIANLNLFAKGDARVLPTFNPVAAKIAAVLEKEPGPVYVDGYTDSDPIKTREYPSNHELSDARARAVAALLKPGLSKAERLKATGYADRGCENRQLNEAAKTKCRRVEVSIERAE